MLPYLIIFAIGITAGAVYAHCAIRSEEKRHAAAMRRASTPQQIVRAGDASRESYDHTL